MDKELEKNIEIITGIDIGTTKTIVLIAEWEDENNFKIIGSGISKSEGLSKGIVVDIKKTTDAIIDAIQQAEAESGQRIDNAFIGLTGEHIKGINYSGVITINRNNNRQPIGQEIDRTDIDRVTEHAQSINISPERKILHVLNQSYKVDNRDGIKNPLGLTGHRLEAKVHLVTSAINVENDIRTCMNNININVNSFVLEPLASAYASLDKNERNLGVVLIDIGGGTTDVIVYKDGGVMHAGSIPIGGNNITSDIAYGFQISLEQAENLKCNHGIAKISMADQEQNIVISGISGRESKNVSEFELASIIEPRVDEIFRLAKNEINKSNCQDENTFGIVLTGGGSQLKSINDLAQYIFQQNIKIGYPICKHEIPKKIDSPRYSTAFGLVKYGITHWIESEYEHISFYSIVKDFIKKIKQLFNKWY